MSATRKEYLAKYLAPKDLPPAVGVTALPAGAAGLLPHLKDKKTKTKKKKLRTSLGQTIIKSQATTIIDENDDDWAMRRGRDDEDDEMAPTVVTGLKEESKFVTKSWTVLRPGEDDVADAGAGEASAAAGDDGRRRRRRTPSPSPPPAAPRDEDDHVSRRRSNGDADGDDYDDASRTAKRQRRMEDGTGAGLQSAEDVRRDLQRRRVAEAAALAAMDPSQSGRYAKTIVRDKIGRQVDVEELRAREEAMAEQKRLEEAERLRFKRGLAQERDAERNKMQLERERVSKFAVYVDDEERNERMRERDRWGDPLAGMAAAGASGRKGKKSDKPKYAGPGSAPNRFGIPPGYRWDGVDRGNGFEVKLVQSRYSKQIRTEEAHMWSTEDM